MRAALGSAWAQKRKCVGTKKLVSKGGLEPPRPFERQPLKLVRLPIPPLRRGTPRLSTN